MGEKVSLGISYLQPVSQKVTLSFEARGRLLGLCQLSVVPSQVAQLAPGNGSLWENPPKWYHK